MRGLADRGNALWLSSVAIGRVATAVAGVRPLWPVQPWLPVSAKPNAAGGKISRAKDTCKAARLVLQAGHVRRAARLGSRTITAAFKAFLKSCERVLADCARARRGRQGLPPPHRAGGGLRGSQPARRRRSTKDSAQGLLRAQFHAQRGEPQRAARPADRLLRAGARGLAHAAGRLQTPIYKRPPDLVNLVDETQRGAVRHGAHPCPQDRQGHRALSPRARRSTGRAQGPGPGAPLPRRPGRRLLHADPGLGPRQADRRHHPSACTTTARTAIPTARSAAT